MVLKGGIGFENPVRFRSRSVVPVYHFWRIWPDLRFTRRDGAITRDPARQSRVTARTRVPFR
jgi:hypothetical protein